MESLDSNPSSPIAAPISPQKNIPLPDEPKIVELTETKSELLSRIQGFKKVDPGLMGSLDSNPSSPIEAPISPKKESLIPDDHKIAELTETKSELLSRIQGLKRDLQSWRSKLNTQVTMYRDELTGLKKSLNIEVEELRSGFQELRTTLQQQQEDVKTSLKNIELPDISEDVKEAPVPEPGEDADEFRIAAIKEKFKEETSKENGIDILQ